MIHSTEVHWIKIQSCFLKWFNSVFVSVSSLMQSYISQAQT